MRGVRVAVLSFSFLLSSTLLLPDGALAQRGTGGQTGVSGRVGGHTGIHGRRLAAPRVLHHRGGHDRRLAAPRAFHDRGFHDRRRFHGPMFRRRVDHFGSFGFPHRRFGFSSGFPRDRFFFGSPHRGFLFGFPHRSFFFGFPRHRLDFFGIPGPGHHFGFPRHRFFFGFQRHHFGFFGPGWLPVGIALGSPLAFDRERGDTRSFDGTYLGAPLTGPAGDAAPAGEIKQVVDPRVAVAGAGGAGDSLVVERVSVVGKVTRTGVRLTWQDAGQPAEEVTLFLADTTRNALAVQTVRAPLYSALFEPPPGTAFAGMTVVWPDGSASTRVVAYRPLGR